LGVLLDQQYEVKTIKIEKGTNMVIYTDGLEEAMNKEGEQYGLDRIIRATMANQEKTGKEIAHAITEDVLRFCGGNPLHDDVTMIVAKGI
jgi:serine phosphatase RsbU (regulator of sigma subunit)